ncbi:endonuclease III [Dehalobacterium formicoaceticum]|uniref:Endonuclease III n=1 Tax=Dehalobacterium formicoaceticum TaxID=51515 RepID=A0ABT1XZT5_9FIRM|nr:endonuclease III [Dehalobacterium formicoaceticum]MCR6544125.1 endonuclease III [Dehalobacterium formicoaceticum]
MKKTTQHNKIITGLDKVKQDILEILEETYQGTSTALNFSTPFELMVATILSAQTNDNQVNKITESLFKKYRTPQQFSTLQPEELEQEIKTCGLYKNKAKNIIAAAKLIQDQFDGQIPQTREELMLLPGVGRKTANVILSNAFGIPAFAVDTHVFRVSARLGLSSGTNPAVTESELTALIPEEKWGDAHHWLIWHGRKICIARKPKCSLCPVNQLCPSNQEYEEAK